MTNIFFRLVFSSQAWKDFKYWPFSALHAQATFFIVASSALIEQGKCFVIEQNGLKKLPTTRN